MSAREIYHTSQHGDSSKWSLFFKVKVYVMANYSCFLIPKATNYTCIESTGEYFVCYLSLHVKGMLLQYVVLKRYEGYVVIM